MSKFVINKYSVDKKSLSVLFNFLIWLILGLFICFVGITKTDALVIDGKFQGQSVNTNIGIDANGYIQNNSYITVDESNALNYYVAEICTTNNVFSISKVSSHSGNISYSRSITNIKTCNTTNYNGTLAKIYFKVNQWADAGNGNFGVIFNFRLNSNVSFYTDIRIMNIYTTNEIDETSVLLNNQTNELNNSINNSTNTITGSIGDAENNINSNINDMEQSIVDSNKETQDVIKDQFNSCKQGDNILNNITWINGSYINSDNNIIDSQSWKHTDYIDISDYEGNYIYKNDVVGNTPKTILYDENKNVLQVLSVNNTTTYSLQKYNAKYIRISTNMVGKPELYVEEICSNRLDEQNDKLNDINGSLNNSDSSGATNDASNFFSNFTTDTFGLTSIITAPLSLINNLTSSSCSTLSLPLPYLDNKFLELPCMETIYTRYFGIFFNLYQTITFGIVSYWVIVRIFNQVKDFKNPEHDEIEVLDL